MTYVLRHGKCENRVCENVWLWLVLLSPGNSENKINIFTQPRDYSYIDKTRLSFQLHKKGKWRYRYPHQWGCRKCATRVAGVVSHEFYARYISQWDTRIYKKSSILHLPPTLFPRYFLSSHLVAYFVSSSLSSLEVLTVAFLVHSSDEDFEEVELGSGSEPEVLRSQSTTMPRALATIMLCGIWLHNDTFARKKTLMRNFMVYSFWNWSPWEARKKLGAKRNNHYRLFY